MEDEAARQWRPQVILVDESNRILPRERLAVAR